MEERKQTEARDGIILRVQTGNPFAFISLDERPSSLIMFGDGACTILSQSLRTSELVLLCPKPGLFERRRLWVLDRGWEWSVKGVMAEYQKKAFADPDRYLDIPDSVLSNEPITIETNEELRKRYPLGE